MSGFWRKGVDKRIIVGILFYFTGNGFRNREHFKTAIYFHCGGLQLYPVTH